MFTSVFIIGLITGLLALVGAFFAGWSNRFAVEHSTASWTWLRTYRWRWLGGTVFAIASAFAQYPVSVGGERYRVIGFPFMAGALDSAGRDYIGSLTIVLLLGNAAIWFFLPQFVLFFWRTYSARKAANA